MEIQFKNLSNALEQFIQDLCSSYKEALLRDGKKATGNLVNSIKALDIEFSNNKMQGTISLASYWKYVEYGRKPGKWPPRDKILNWVKVKPVIPRPNGNAKPPTQEQLAFLIQRKIGTEGIKPGNQFEATLREVWRRWESKISEAISLDLMEQIELLTVL